jgi:hypothetical protein
VQFFSTNGLQNLHTDQALKLSTSKCVEEDSLVLIHDLFSGNNTCHRETISNSLGHCNDVWLEACPSVTPELLSNSTKTCLNLISNYNTSIFSDNLSDSWAITLRDRVDSSNTLNGFEDHASNFSMNGI